VTKLSTEFPSVLLWLLDSQSRSYRRQFNRSGGNLSPPKCNPFVMLEIAGVGTGRFNFPCTIRDSFSYSSGQVQRRNSHLVFARRLLSVRYLACRVLLKTTVHDCAPHVNHSNFSHLTIVNGTLGKHSLYTPSTFWTSLMVGTVSRC